jgi:hypothetical protein
MKTGLGNLVVGLIIAVISARVTVHFALKRFYLEKWWERKAEAYSSIIEALHHMKNYADHQMAFHERGRELPEDGKKELSEKMRCGIAEIRKRADIGAFVISEEAVVALRTLQKDLDESTNTQDWYEHLDQWLWAVNKCLDSMRSIAKNDLKGPMTAREHLFRFLEVLKKLTK